MNKKIKLSKQENAGNIPMYKPKLMTQEDMKQGLSGATERIRQQRMTTPQKIDVRQSQQYGNPRFGQPQIPNYWAPQQQTQQPPQQQNDDNEPYWTAEEWESWAYQLYHQYPDTQKFLPEWFIQAVNQEEKK